MARRRQQLPARGRLTAGFLLTLVGLELWRALRWIRNCTNSGWCSAQSTMAIRCVNPDGSALTSAPRSIRNAAVSCCPLIREAKVVAVELIDSGDAPLAWYARRMHPDRPFGAFGQRQRSRHHRF